ncbi:hypothetical protein NMY22_g11200 [Coprinellus aureogranulatus]|nr:hypothetical protein NMY22_g11200 [Coprinellus aureogranulatus]
MPAGFIIPLPFPWLVPGEWIVIDGPPIAAAFSCNDDVDDAGDGGVGVGGEVSGACTGEEVRLRSGAGDETSTADEFDDELDDTRPCVVGGGANAGGIGLKEDLSAPPEGILDVFKIGREGFPEGFELAELPPGFEKPGEAWRVVDGESFDRRGWKRPSRACIAVTGPSDAEGLGACFAELCGSGLSHNDLNWAND